MTVSVNQFCDVVISYVKISWFVSIVRHNFRETLSNFYHNFHIRYHDMSTSFMIFRLYLLFIEFETNSPTSLRSCSVNKMFEFGAMFMDTALT